MKEAHIIDLELKDISYIYNMIQEENKRQVDKWGIQDRHIFEWAMWTTEEFGEFIQAVKSKIT